MNNSQNNEHMCPFCPLLVEPELCDPIENDFFGKPANIKGIRSCAACAMIAEMTNDSGQLLIDMLKEQQAKQPA